MGLRTSIYERPRRRSAPPFHFAAEAVMSLPVPVRSDPYHGWLVRAFLALIVMFLLALMVSKT